MIAMSMPVFFVRDPLDFIEFSQIAIPTATKAPGLLQRIRDELRLLPTPTPNVYNAPTAPRSDELIAWANEHPESKGPIAGLGGLVTPASYGRCAYHGVHSFVLVDGAEVETVVRYSWWPVQGVRPADRTKQGLPENYLHEELRERLRRGPFEFTLQFLVAEDGDDIDDPTTALDHNHRARLIGGRLVVTGLDAGGGGCEELSYNATRVIPGFEMSADKILAARGHAYRVSSADRHRYDH